jgi:WD40 repeat protein
MVRVWSTADGKLIREWKPSSPANDAAFSPDGRRLALGFSNGEGEVRRVADWSVEQGFKTTASWLNSIAFSHDGRRLFCAANNGHVYVFSSDDWRKIFTFRTHVDSLHKTRVQIQRLAASESGNVLAAYQANGSLRIWLTDESLP